MDSPPPRLLICDLDGTLISSHLEYVRGRLAPVRPYEDIIWHPETARVIRDLQYRGTVVVVATNQGGPAFGHMTAEHALRRCRFAAHKLGILDGPEHQVAADTWIPEAPAAPQRSSSCRVYVALGHPAAPPHHHLRFHSAWRKPGPGMIHAAMHDHDVPDPADVALVGDMDTDQQAAEAAGVEFLGPEQAWGPSDQRVAWARTLGNAGAFSLPYRSEEPHFHVTYQPESTP